jgi:hypothetical protein
MFNKTEVLKMAKSTRSPLQNFFAKSLKMARSRDKMNNRVSDDNVTIDYLCGLYYGQNALCFHTGEIMTIERGLIEGAVCFTLCTMDRIDNAQGYNVGNIILACDGINRMRSDMPLSQFRALCNKIGMNG